MGNYWRVLRASHAMKATIKEAKSGSGRQAVGLGREHGTVKDCAIIQV